MNAYKIFCDESCHLEFDKSDIMVLGSICCTAAEVPALNKEIKELRHKHGYHNEIKWTKLINKQKDFYSSLLEMFFASTLMRFKATIVTNKHLLNHESYNDGEHDKFYYKMFYYTLRDFMKPDDNFQIYLDYKDTKGGQRARKLSSVICNESRGSVNADFTIIHSHESQMIQLCDLLIGAIAYKNRTDIEKRSDIKNFIIVKIEELSGRHLDEPTAQWEEKFNLFKFSPRKW